MKLQWAVAGVVLAWGTAALAQESKPSVTPFPVELSRAPNVSDADKADLQSTWRRLLRVVALVPDTGTVDGALVETGRRDCEREDECLKALAVKAKTLYAAYATVGLDVTRTKVVASGRVVRDDGKLMGDAGKEIRTAVVELGTDSFAKASKTALARLVEQLGVQALSPVRGVEVPKVTVDADPRHEVRRDPYEKRQPAEVKAVPESNAAGLRIGSLVMMGVGVAGAGAGAGLLISAGADETKLGVDANGFVHADRTVENAALAAGMVPKRAVGGVLLGVGLAAAATGAALFVLARNAEAGDEQLAVGAMPLAGGGMMASLGGTF